MTFKPGEELWYFDARAKRDKRSRFKVRKKGEYWVFTDDTWPLLYDEMRRFSTWQGVMSHIYATLLLEEIEKEYRE